MFDRFETSQIFYPTRASDDWIAPAEVGLNAEDVELKSSTGETIHGWWCPGKPPADPRTEGALLFSHGNAGNLSHRGYPILELQHYISLPVLIYDYPGYGRSTGRPDERACYAAADAAYDWLVQVKGVAPERIVLFGESLGGGPSVELARRRPFRTLVLARTFTSIPDMAGVIFPYLPLRWFIRNRFDNLAKIDQCMGPILIAHGDCDSLIPYAQAQRLYEKARAPKRFFHMPGCDHSDPLAPPFYEALRDYLTETAPLPRTGARSG